MKLRMKNDPEETRLHSSAGYGDGEGDDDMVENGGTSKGTIVREGRTEADPLGLRRRRGGRKRPPGFTTEPGFEFNYKDPQQLKFFITDRGKITPRRISGLTARQQRQLTQAIKRARNIALLPFTATR